METVLVQINNQKAYKLLENLEELKILRVLKKSVMPKQKLSEKYKGIITKEQGQDLNEHIKEMRSEWNSI